jgi:sugar/nucleoside kinase (ribokinase family)
MKEAISFANAAGALTVMNKGAQDSLPARATVEQLLKQLDG